MTLTTRSISPRVDWRLLLACFGYAALLLLLLSSNSYLHEIFQHEDEDWYYTCGKAWMCGMTPYVDFADSKGPLLWLIYGIAYLIDNHSFVGAFWLCCLAYTATFAIAYKLSRLFAGPRAAVTAVAVTVFVLFLPTYNYETKAETFCMPLVFLSLYILCATLKGRERPLNDGLALGLATGCCLMIKWNIALMMLAPCAIFTLLERRAGGATKALAGIAAGMAAVCAPFLAYLAALGAMSEFFNEYFAVTASTIFIRVPLSAASFTSRVLAGSRLFLLLAACTALFCWRQKGKWWWLLAMLLWFRAGCGPTLWKHYMMTMLPFAIFPALIIVDVARTKLPKRLLNAPAACVLITAATLLIDSANYDESKEELQRSREGLYRGAYVMRQVDKPTIICVGAACHESVVADALPACRYWKLQSGATSEMLALRRKAVADGAADFVCYAPGSGEQITEQTILDAGYVYYCRAIGEERVYGRPGCSLPPSDFKVTDLDVWLKRDVIKRYLDK